LLLDRTQIEYQVVQRDLRDRTNLIDHRKDLTDFSRTAGLLAT
jgi:hypothetical protein